MTAGFCECGCGERTRIAPKSNAGKGHVKGEPFRFVNGHTLRKHAARMNRERAIPWRQRVTASERGCLVWLGCLNSKGYGCIGDGSGGVVLTHRMVWEEQHGSIPDGLTIDHRCLEKRCLNTAHMELVTRGENSRRRFRPPGLLSEEAA